MNRRIHLLLAAAAALAAAPIAQAQAPGALRWHRGVHTVSKGSFQANRYGAHRNIRGGLSAAVGVTAWPQLGLYVREWDNWIDPNVGFVVPGDASAAKAGSIELADASWTHERYRFAEGDTALECTISRLTPAVLFRTDAPRLTLFRDARLTREVTPPAWAAALGRDGRPVTIGRGQAFDALGEGWVIVGFGQESGWRERIRSSAGSSFGEYGLDWPWLVLIAGRPERVALGDNGLEIASAGGVGYVAALPLFGVRTIEWEESDALRAELPAPVIERARRLRELLGRYPVGAKDEFAVDGRTLRVRQRFEYVEVPDAWVEQPRPAAPIPPLVHLARTGGMDLSVEGEPLDLAYPTVVGPYAVVPGTDTLQYAAPDLLDYVWEAPRYDLGAPDPRIVERLAAEAQRMVEAGHLAPVLFHAGEPYWDFYDRAELFATLAELAAVLPQERRAALQAYIDGEFATYNPLTGRALAKGEGTRREPYAILPEKLQGEIGGGLPYTGMYDLWRWADASGGWDVLRQNWPRILAAFQGQDLALIDWAYLGTGGSTAELTRTLTAYIGLARIAARLGQEPIRRLAEYEAGQLLIARYAYGQMAFHFHASGQDHEWVRLNRPDAPTRVTGHGSYAHPGPSEDYAYLRQLYRQGAFALPEDQAAELERLADAIDSPARRDTRQVADLTELWVRLSTVRDPRIYMNFNLLGFEGASPEVFRFLRERMHDDLLRYLSLIEIKMPGWYLTDPWTRGVWIVHNFADWGIDPPRFGYWLFQAEAQFRQAPPERLRAYLDIPYCVGDLMYFQKALATLRAGGTVRWEGLDRP